MAERAAIDRPLAERYKVWRLAQIREKKFSRRGRGLMLDVAILHRIFAFAVETEMVAKNPVRIDGRPGDNPDGEAQPLRVRSFRNCELLRVRTC